VLFAVVFLWTPPHFWALAIICDDDYAATSVPMLPVVRGRQEAARRGLRYAIATVAASLVLPFTGAGVGLVYGAAAAALGVLFLRRGLQLRLDARPAVARRLFTFSIVYLGVLFCAIVVDQVLPLPWG
jgi:protoheme IX farnesyltransferase